MFKIKKPNLKKINRRKLLTALAIILVMALFFLGRSLFVAAWVGKTPIFRISLIKELEKQGGKQVLESLIDRTLVLKEAKKQKITVSQNELDAALAAVEENVKSQGLTLEDALKFSNITREKFLEELRYQKLKEKLVSTKIKITDNEIKDFYDKNKDLYGKGTTLESVKNNIRNQIYQTKFNEVWGSFIAELRKNARIVYFKNF